jgi:hypothetical protein
VREGDPIHGRRWHVHCLAAGHNAPPITLDTTAHMQRKSLWHSIRFAIASLGVVACAADPATAPRVSAEANPGLVADLLGGLVSKDVLTRKQPLSRDITVSADIDKDGGRLSIPAAGFELIIPKNAVKTPTTFTVTALKGKLVAYEFGPHGIAFGRALQAKQNLSATDWSLLALRPLTAGYFAEKSQLNPARASALLSEVISGVTVPLTKQFSWPIEHFSGYVVAW